MRHEGKSDIAPGDIFSQIKELCSLSRLWLSEHSPRDEVIRFLQGSVKLKIDIFAVT